LNWFRKIIEVPGVPGDEEKSIVAQRLNVVGWYYLLGLVVIALVFVPFFAVRKIESWAILLVLLISFGVARYLFAHGKLIAASVVVVASGWCVFFGMVVFGDGIHSPLMMVVVSLTLVIGMLFPKKAAGVFLGVSLVGALLIALYQQSGGFLPQVFTFSPLSIWFFFVVSLIFINQTVGSVMGSLEKALDQARQQNRAREKAETTLRASEAKYRQLHESMRDGLFWWI
jgi:hypothetical protein